jgi:adenylosuccinate synthase
VGGTNSGHTVITSEGEALILRQLPTAAILPGVYCVLPPGSYIDLDILLKEIEKTGIEKERGALRVFCKPLCLLPGHIFCKDVIECAVDDRAAKLEHIIAIGDQPPGPGALKPGMTDELVG